MIETVLDVACSLPLVCARSAGFTITPRSARRGGLKNCAATLRRHHPVDGSQLYGHTRLMTERRHYQQRSNQHGSAGIAAAAFSDASGPPAWKKLRSWAVVATGDKAAGADVVRSMAQRAGADIIEVEGSHVIMISQPQAVADHILKAARAVVT
jgi:pimeloyl-ACP methyl ester carboxylesterase